MFNQYFDEYIKCLAFIIRLMLLNKAHETRKYLKDFGKTKSNFFFCGSEFKSASEMELKWNEIK